MRPSQARVLGLILIALLLGRFAAAADFSHVNLESWLRIWRTSSGISYPPLTDPEEYVYDQEILVTKGGGYFSNISLRQNPLGEPLPFHTAIMRGVATPVELALLPPLLNDARIGFQRDCYFFAGSQGTETVHLSWYGRGGRRNQVSLYGRGVPDATLPMCPEALLGAVGGVNLLGSYVSSHRDTEILMGGPPF